MYLSTAYLRSALFWLYS